MKRRTLIAILVLAGALLTAAVSAQARSTRSAEHARSAQAGGGHGVNAKRVDQARGQVASYWTTARMRNAKPVERARGGKPGKPGGGGGGGGGKNDAGKATEVPGPYLTPPASTNGRVFFTDGGADYACSGTAVTSNNQSVVWTAGHCVNQGAGDFYTNWTFVPGYRDGDAPFGTWPAAILRTTTGWGSSGDLSYDLGAATVSTGPGGATLTATVGSRALAFYGSPEQDYEAFGYPAGRKFDGMRLWTCASALYTRDTSASPATLGIRCNMTGGSSGGAWAGADGSVYSVTSYGYPSLKDVLFGPYQGAAADALLTAAQG